jgi:hypothetical protein
MAQVHMRVSALSSKEPSLRTIQRVCLVLAAEPVILPTNNDDHGHHHRSDRLNYELTKEVGRTNVVVMMFIPITSGRQTSASKDCNENLGYQVLRLNVDSDAGKGKRRPG